MTIERTLLALRSLLERRPSSRRRQRYSHLRSSRRPKRPIFWLALPLPRGSTPISSHTKQVSAMSESAHADPATSLVSALLQGPARLPAARAARCSAIVRKW